MATLPESDIERMRFFAVKELIKALHAHKISAEQLPMIAKDVLTETENAHTPDQLTEALYAIGKKYDSLQPISSLYRSYIGERLAEQSAHELTQLLKDDDLEAAHHLAQSIKQP